MCEQDNFKQILISFKTLDESFNEFEESSKTQFKHCSQPQWRRHSLEEKNSVRAKIVTKPATAHTVWIQTRKNSFPGPLPLALWLVNQCLPGAPMLGCPLVNHTSHMWPEIFRAAFSYSDWTVKSYMSRCWSRLIWLSCWTRKKKKKSRLQWSNIGNTCLWKY